MSYQVLALENALLRSSFEAARVGICVIDANGLIVTTTSLFARSVGVDFDALLGQPVTALMKSLAIRSHWDALTGIDQPEVATEATGNVSDQKQHLLLEARSFEHGGDHFRLLSLIDFAEFGVSRDKLIMFRRHMEGVRTSVVVADALKFDLPIVYANPQFFETTGYRASEVLGRNCRMLQGPLTEPGQVDRIRDGLKSHRVVSVVLTNYRKDGTPFKNELTISPLFDEHGKLTHFGATQRVLTAREPLGSQLGA